ncbi:MAG: FkbM family methyltransferase [Aurantimicrobium sp.]|uniref:FkbM family methyltransferase n=1 Tax=Aurantimicrobium sp. TaxID=1930784 RepID=UPI002FC8DEBE
MRSLKRFVLFVWNSLVHLVLKIDNSLSEYSLEKRVKTSFDTAGGIGKQTLKSLFPATGPQQIIEIGAHKGVDTEEFAVLFPGCNILSFEADPNIFSYAAKKLIKYQNVRINPFALSEGLSLTLFNVSSGAGDGSGSILKPEKHLTDHPEIRFHEQDRRVVPVATLDDVLALSNEIGHIDLIWIDVQGAELMVFRGASSALKRTNYIYAEVSTFPSYRGGVSYSDLKAFLEESGFEVEREFLPPEWNGDGNVLFKRTLEDNLNHV